MNAQGLGGNIKPFLGQYYIDKQNKYNTNDDGDKDYNLLNKQLGINTKPIDFRFINDFSNSYSYNEPDFHFDVPDIGYNYTGEVEAGYEGHGYNAQTNELAGSRDIEYYTNNEIVNGIAKNKGFIDSSTDGYSRDENDQVGGFKIINQSGVNYHFALPAYNFEEYQYTENSEHDQAQTFSERFKKEKYAYTWYLTAVTGPDYVDRNNNGLVDDNDWGYWVEFNYGKWADSYYWRNPGEGFNKDIESKFQTFSDGYKQIYYLDAIRTRSHTALFVKDIRNDGKSAINDTWKAHSDTKFEGGFFPRTLRQETYALIGSISYNGFYATHYSDYTGLPTSLMKLDKIVLIKNEDLGILNKDLGQEFEQNQTGDRTWSEYDPYQGRSATQYRISKQIGTGPIERFHQPENVFDIYDFANVEPTIEASIIREISLETDYSLAQGTPNSYPSSMLSGNSISTDNADYLNALTGKLTLKKVHFKGKGSDGSLMPPVTFDYGKNPDYDKDAFDLWGFYKNNFDESLYSTNQYAGRIVNSSSAEDVDAWSLNNIWTSSGSKIQIAYEADEYIPVLDVSHPLPVSLDIDRDQSKLYLELDFPYDHQRIFNEETSINLLVGYIGRSSSDCSCTTCGSEGFYVTPFHAEAKNIQSSKIEIESPTLLNFINQRVCNFNYAYANTIYFSNALIASEYKSLGGGLRVKSISVTTNSNTSQTQYEYLEGKSSYEPYGLDGVTGAPNEGNLGKFRKALYTKFTRLLANSRELPAPGVIYGQVRKRETFNGQYLPGHSVFEFQTFHEEMVGIDRDVRPEESLDVGNSNYQGYAYDQVRRKTIAKKDFTTQLGALKEIVFYDNNGRAISKTINHYLYDDPNSETKLEELYNKQGYTEETYAHASLSKVELLDGNEEFQMLAVLAKHQRYPLIQSGQTNINYLTGITTTTKNLAFDFFSGDVVKTLSTDGKGNTFITEMKPAYHKYPGMGLAMYGGANMLIQNAITTSYQVDSEANQNPIGLLSASVQTWSDEVEELDGIIGPRVSVTYYAGEQADGTYRITNSSGDLEIGQKIKLSYFSDWHIGTIVDRIDATMFKIKFRQGPPNLIPGAGVVNMTADIINTYRKHRSYTYLGNDVDLSTQPGGLYPYSTLEDNAFDAWVHGQEPSSNQWQKNSEITLYDVYSHALEAKDVNGNFAATKMDSKQEQVFATVANAEYDEFAYSGAEDDLIDGKFGGDVLKPGGTIVSTQAHTGSKSIFTSGTGHAFEFTAKGLSNDRTYRASIWSTQPTAYYKYKVGGDSWQTASTRSSKQAGDWYLHNVDIPYAGGGDLSVAFRGQTSTNIYWDDFRFHPLDATMTSYVYNQWGELSYILDANNIYTHYEYDAMGRLTATYRETFDYDKDGTDDGKVKVSSHQIHYAKQGE